jgi:uncharacterized damage-inducible protein DinB
MIQYGGPELAKAYRTVRNNTIQIARDIPEDKYGFSPAPGTRTVAALLVHIAYGARFAQDAHRTKRITTLKGYDFPAMHAGLRAEEATPRSKAEIIALLEEEGDSFASWLETLDPEFLAETFTDPMGENARTRFESILSAKEHEMHHRGQLMLIERMLGIVPHMTRAMQERMAARAGAAG